MKKLTLLSVLLFSGIMNAADHEKEVQKETQVLSAECEKTEDCRKCQSFQVYNNAYCFRGIGEACVEAKNRKRCFRKLNLYCMQLHNDTLRKCIADAAKKADAEKKNK